MLSLSFRFTGLGNFEPKEVERRDGPGEAGKAYVLPEDQQNRASDAEMEYGMNIVVSDTISLDRTIRDTRLEECKHWDYPHDLPSTSVIIVFHNEGFSVLMRTVHSVLNRSPKHVLHEILLVDDFSDKEDLKEKLENYIERFDGKVRLIRNVEREGLIRTRSRGAKEATGEVIVYLDAHCEVNTNWLPPLLAPIYRDRTIMTVPVIDGIDHKTFEYRPVYADGHHYRLVAHQCTSMIIVDGWNFSGVFSNGVCCTRKMRFHGGNRSAVSTTANHIRVQRTPEACLLLIGSSSWRLVPTIRVC